MNARFSPSTGGSRPWPARSTARVDEQGSGRRLVRYELRLAETLSQTARAAFPDLRVRDSRAGTLLWGPVRDRAHLHGLIGRVETLGLTLVELRELPD